jgi:hypothetical protein
MQTFFSDVVIISCDAVDIERLFKMLPLRRKKRISNAVYVITQDKEVIRLPELNGKNIIQAVGANEPGIGFYLTGTTFVFIVTNRRWKTICTGSSMQIRSFKRHSSNFTASKNQKYSSHKLHIFHVGSRRHWTV